MNLVKGKNVYPHDYPRGFLGVAEGKANLMNYNCQDLSGKIFSKSASWAASARILRKWDLLKRNTDKGLDAGRCKTLQKLFGAIMQTLYKPLGLQILDAISFWTRFNFFKASWFDFSILSRVSY